MWSLSHYDNGAQHFGKYHLLKNAEIGHELCQMSDSALNNDLTMLL